MEAWEFDWEEVDGYLRPRTTPLTPAEREQKWVRDNWERLDAVIKRVEEATKCRICKKSLNGIVHEFMEHGVRVVECDECYHWHPPPADTRPAEPIADRQYHGGYGSETLGRFRKEWEPGEDSEE